MTGVKLAKWAAAVALVAIVVLLAGVAYVAPLPLHDTAFLIVATVAVGWVVAEALRGAR